MPTSPDCAMIDQKLFVTRTTQPWPDLFERWWDNDRSSPEWIWVDHQRPESVQVATAPGAAMMDQKAFVGVADGRLFENFWNGMAWV
jgi:hypothetical protein